MAYAAWSVVFGEQPSAAKWNILGTNDASFNDGSGIGTNAISAESLKTNAITLGRTTSTSSPTLTTGAAATTICSCSVTIPSGSRDIELIGYIPNISAGGASIGAISLVDNTTILQINSQKWQDSGFTTPGFMYLSLTGVSAGAKTYHLKAQSSSGANLQVNGSSTQIAVLTVKAI